LTEKKQGEEEEEEEEKESSKGEGEEEEKEKDSSKGEREEEEQIEEKDIPKPDMRVAKRKSLPTLSKEASTPSSSAQTSRKRKFQTPSPSPKTLMSPNKSLGLTPTKRTAKVVPAKVPKVVLPEVDKDYDAGWPCKSLTKKEAECTCSLFQNKLLLPLTDFFFPKVAVQSSQEYFSEIF